MRTARVLALLAAVSAFFLLRAGAQVNAYQAALSVPTWPLSYGKLLLTEWPGNVFYEQHHRATAAATVVLFAAALAAIGRRRELAAARRYGGWAAAALAVQVVLGGLVVLELDPPWLAALHAVLALVTVVLVAAMALLTFAGSDPKAPGDPRLQRRAAIGLGLLALQATLGAASRHPPAGELVFVTTLMAHLANGLLTLLWVTFLALSILRRGPAAPLRTWGWILLAGAAAQLAAGAWVFVVAPEPWAEPWPPPAGFPAAHQTHLVLAAILGTGLAAVRLRADPGVVPVPHTVIRPVPR